MAILGCALRWTHLGAFASKLRNYVPKPVLSVYDRLKSFLPDSSFITMHYTSETRDQLDSLCPQVLMIMQVLHRNMPLLEPDFLGFLDAGQECVLYGQPLSYRLSDESQRYVTRHGTAYEV